MKGFIMKMMILGKKDVFRGNMRERLTYRIYVDMKDKANSQMGQIEKSSNFIRCLKILLNTRFKIQLRQGFSPPNTF